MTTDTETSNRHEVMDMNETFCLATTCDSQSYSSERLFFLLFKYCGGSVCFLLYYLSWQTNNKDNAKAN